MGKVTASSNKNNYFLLYHIYLIYVSTQLDSLCQSFVILTNFYNNKDQINQNILVKTVE